MKVACIGEAMVELAMDATGDTARIGFAGDTLNTAIYLKRAAPALDVAYITRLGRDAFSARMLEFIASENLETADIEISETRHAGLYAITTDAAGERSFTYWRDNSAARDLFQSGTSTSFAALEKYDLLYLSAITLAILPGGVLSDLCSFLTGYRAGGGKVAFDSNYRPALWPDQATAQREIARMWESCDVALPSVDDEMAAFGDTSEASVVARLRSCGVAAGALKRGPTGPLSLGEPVQATYAAAKRVVDTTAAGDSFNGGYLGALLSGASQTEALRAGHALAAHVVGFKGAIVPQVT